MSPADRPAGPATDARPAERATPPPPGPVRAFRFPDYLRRTLSNGLTVLAARVERGPLVELALLFPAGADREPPELAGAASLLGGLLDEGTEDRSALDIAATVEQLGGRLATGADWDVGSLNLQVLSARSSRGLGLLTELATASTLPPDELERQRRRRLADLLRKRSDPSYRATQAFYRAVYEDTPYGHTLMGDEGSVGRLDREHLMELYRHGYVPSGAVLVAVGDLDPEAFVAEAETVLGPLPGGEAPPDPVVEPPPLQGRRIVVVDRPGAAQTELRIGHAGVPRSHPDFLALGVLNALLGGKFTSRINLNLRERNGYTYGAHTTFSSRRGPGPFQVRTAVATPVTGAAVREVLGELERIVEEPVETEELEDAQSYLIGTFPYVLQTVSGLLDRLESLAIHGLPPDHYDSFPETIRAVTREDVLRVARKHLHPHDLAIVAVGAGEELRSQLEGLETATDLQIVTG